MLLLYPAFVIITVSVFFVKNVSMFFIHVDVTACGQQNGNDHFARRNLERWNGFAWEGTNSQWIVVKDKKGYEISPSSPTLTTASRHLLTGF
ncbi:hypothetical protein EDM52_01275 [Brevibacillus invocatus]|uniref:Uncharacterized protein n=1 Tax=Brevibacillus invocatus TaxID=173959 RepID=A0A3M8CNH9_9BACL|nr:hypothetical protein EDM52_01275 [Brevibacillus invocatus]